MAFLFSTTAFLNGQTIPKKYTADGEDLSPRFTWSGHPANTKSFAIIMDDPDAPPGTWVHWILYDVPAQDTELKEGLPKKETLPNGAKQGLVWGVNEFDRVGYFGPSPPPGKPHRYYFKIYALDTLLNLPPRKTKFELEKAMKGHVLAEAQFMGTYGR